MIKNNTLPPGEYTKNRGYIEPKNPKKMEMLRIGGKVIFRNLPEAEPHKVAVEYIHPEPPRHKEKPVELVETVLPTPIAAPITPSSSFAELQAKVEEMRKKESKKAEPIVEEIPVVMEVTQAEDIQDLVDGTITEEAESVTMASLKSLSLATLKSVYLVAVGEKATTENKFELRKTILEKYNKLTSSKKKMVVEATKL